MTRYEADDPLMVGRAIAIAAEIHSGQLDKADEPYFEHAYAVMQRAGDYYLANSDGWRLAVVKSVAVMHDVFEDHEGTDSEKQRLRDRVYQEFPGDVYTALDAMTKRVERWVERDGKQYPIYEEYHGSYIERVARNWIARIGKIADLSHNLDAFRLPNGQITEKDFKRWDKYHRALVRLTKEEASV